MSRLRMCTLIGDHVRSHCAKGTVTNESYMVSLAGLIQLKKEHIQRLKPRIAGCKTLNLIPAKGSKFIKNSSFLMVSCALKCQTFHHRMKRCFLLI